MIPRYVCREWSIHSLLSTAHSPIIALLHVTLISRRLSASKPINFNVEVLLDERFDSIPNLSISLPVRSGVQMSVWRLCTRVDALNN